MNVRWRRKCIITDKDVSSSPLAFLLNKIISLQSKNIKKSKSSRFQQLHHLQQVNRYNKLDQKSVHVKRERDSYLTQWRQQFHLRRRTAVFPGGLTWDWWRCSYSTAVTTSSLRWRSTSAPTSSSSASSAT